MRNAIFVSTLLSGILFISLMSLLGGKYGGKTEDSSYMIFCVGCALVSLVFILLDLFRQPVLKIKISVLCFSLLPLLLLMVYIFEMPASDLAVKYFYLYILWGGTATYIGINVALFYRLYNMAYWCYWMMFILSIGILMDVLIPFLQGRFLQALSERYQTISYVSSLAFSLNLFFLLFKSYFLLPRFANKYIVIFLCYFLLFLQVLVILLSGGRGGFIVVVLSICVFLYIKRRLGELKQSFWIYTFLITGLAFSLLFLNLNKDYDVLNSGIERMFSYISSDGIDISQTSGRDYVYKDALNKIMMKPILGYGVFKYFDYMMYPHNLFLEILLARGIFFFLFFLIVSIYFGYRLRLIIRNDLVNLLLLPFFIYIFTLLMVSGTYLNASLFWFLGSYVFCYTFKNKKIN